MTPTIYNLNAMDTPKTLNEVEQVYLTQFKMIKGINDLLESNKEAVEVSINKILPNLVQDLGDGEITEPGAQYITNLWLDHYAASPV